MKRFLAATASFMIFSLMGLCVALHAQSIKTTDWKICKGASVYINGGLYIKVSSTCNIISVKAENAGPELKDEQFVRPTSNTTYYIEYSDGGVVGTAQARVEIIQPPVLVVELETAVPPQGFCSEAEVRLKAKTHTEPFVYWNISTETDFKPGTEMSYKLNETCRVTVQSYNACGVADTAIDFVVSSKPELENIRFDLNTELDGKFCAECGFFPQRSSILKGASDGAVVESPSLTWADGTANEVPMPVGVLEKQMKLQATVKKTNHCGTTSGTIDTTFNLRVNAGVDCTPRIFSSISLKPCEARPVNLENNYLGMCSIKLNPTLTSTDRISVSSVSRYEETGNSFERFQWAVSWDNYSQSDPAQSLHLSAPYRISCPHSNASPTIDKTMERDIRVQIDTSYLSFKYEYCPDDKADLEITGKEGVVKINEVVLLQPSESFGSLFALTDDTKAHKKVYLSMDPVTEANHTRYTPIRVKVKFEVNEGSCHFTVEREETLELKQKGNCTMEFDLIQSRPCIGESRTLRLSNLPDAAVVDSIILSPNHVFVFGTGIFSQAGKSLEFAPYYAGAPAVDTKTDSVEATAYYHIGGSTQSVSWTKKFEMEVTACPPRLTGNLRINSRSCPMCPGAMLEATVEFRNKTSTDKDKSRVEFVSTAANRVGDDEGWRLGEYKQYMLSRYLFGDMDYRVQVTYNEGDSVYVLPKLLLDRNEHTVGVNNLGTAITAGEFLANDSVKMADLCALVKEAVQDSVCLGDEVDLYVYSQNFYDIIQDIEWGSADVLPVGQGKEEWEYVNRDYANREIKKKMDRFHYKVQAKQPGFYPFKITSMIRDSVVVRYDTIRIAVIDKPRIFIEDTVYACAGGSIDLMKYVDSAVVRSVRQPENLKINTVADGDFRVATAELRYHCHSVSSTIEDKITIRAENPVYNVAQPDGEYCPGDTLELQAGTNGRVTWTRRLLMPGGGLSQADTLMVDGASGKVLQDVMGYSTHFYTVTARTTCPEPAQTVQFRAVSKPEPYVKILDGSACRPEPLFLQTKPFDAAEVDSAKDVRWYVDGQLYTLPSVPPSASVQVVCVAKGLNGCQGSDTIEMKSYDAPDLKVEAEGFSLAGNVLCVNPGEQVSFSASGADDYDWFVASRNSSVSTADRYTLKVDGDDTVYVTGTGKKLGCTTIDAVFVYLKPLAQVTKDTIGCNGDTLGLHPVAEQEVGYTWYKPDGSEICSCRAITFAPYEPKDTGVYKIRFIRKECDVTKEVRLHMYPVPEFGFTNSIFCEDELLSLDVQTGLDDQWKSSSRFVWYGKDGDTLQDKVEQSAYEGSALSLSDAGIYHIEIYVDRCLNEDSVWVQVDAHSHPAFTVDSFYCEGATLSTQAVDQGEGSIYRWYSKNRLPSEGVSNKIALEGLTIEDSTWLTLEIERGACVDDTSVFVHVRSLPIAKIVAQGANGDADGTYYCEGMPISLFVDGMRSGDTMSWYHQCVLQEGFSSDRYSIKESKLADSGWYAFHVNRNGCTGKDSLYVDVRVVPIPLVSDTFMCSGKTLVVNASNPLFPGSTFIWEPSNTTGEQFDITAGGTYTVRMRYNGCEGDSTFTVEERPTPQIDFPDEATICQRDSIILTGPDGMEIYLWQDGSSQQTYVVTTEGLYTLYVEMAGCSDYREVMVHEDFCSNLYFPSAFTPNGDGHNDRFGPITTAEDDQVVYSLYIYNRNGEKVFETHSLKDSWDGTFKGEKCPAGIYVYQCKAHAKQNGRNLSGKGTLNLLR